MQGQICDILKPQLAMNRFLPLWPHRFPHFEYITVHLEGGGGVGGGALILDRCRAFDLFASVDAHLCRATKSVHKKERGTDVSLSVDCLSGLCFLNLSLL